MSHPKIKNIYDLIDMMRERPAMYLGRMSIELMRIYLDAFRHAAREFGGLEPETPPFDEFNPWVAAGFRRTGSFASFNRVLFAEAQFCLNKAEAEIEYFYLALDIFRTRQSTHRAQVKFATSRPSTISGSENQPSKTSQINIYEYQYFPPEDSMFKLCNPHFDNYREFYVIYQLENHPRKNEIRFVSLEAAMEHITKEFKVETREWTLLS